MGLFKRIFGRKKREFSQAESERYDQLKERALEGILGRMHNRVLHAIIPFDIGGAFDLYYFLEHLSGTGVATMELIDPDGHGPRPNDRGTFELVAFTKLSYSEEREEPYAAMEYQLSSMLSTVGHFSRQAVLKPGDTCELPQDDHDDRCILLSAYEPDGRTFTIDGRDHHLMLCMEVHRSEMEYSRQEGSAALLERLKCAGFYPYSDLDRTPVV